jgi:cytidylate kinase
MAVITISRELGSNARQVIDLLCERLGYCRVDKALLTHIAEEAGIDVRAVLAKERDVASKPHLISDQMTSLYGRQPTAFGREGEIDDQTYAQVVRETMERFASQGDAIIVGRGGQVILRDWPGALHVHIYAPPEVRAQRLAERHSITKLDAQRRIQRSDERKRAYIRNMHRNANWKDLKYYDLAINSEHLTPEAMADVILTMAQTSA